MDPKQIAKQIVDFNKTAFDNSFATRCPLFRIRLKKW
jgi:hypothetical protein